MRLVVMSDTHLRHNIVVPDGDLFIHCGDSTMDGRTKQLKAVGEWLASLPHRHKIIIAGNHDLTLERFRSFPKRFWPAATYLRDSSEIVDGLKIYGSPWQPAFHDWAFNLPRGAPLARKWARIPLDTDILVTHGPPMGILDRVSGESAHLGCVDLLARVGIVKPRLHLFGHIHSGHGTWENDGTLFVNASICDEEYRVRYAPIVLDVASDGVTIVSA
jgi:predicted phosphodiesterase